MNPVAQAIVDSLPGAYVEVSPSGTGIHIWGRAILPKGYRFDYQGQPVEIYPNGRYLTVTARVLRAGNLVPLNLNNLIAKSDTLTA